MLRNLLGRLGKPAAPAVPAANISAANIPVAPAPAAAGEDTGPFDVYRATAAAQERGDHAQAAALFRAHIARHPDDADAIATFGGHLVTQGELDAAQEVLLPALKRFPGMAPILFNSGTLAQARMQTDEAIRLFRLALAAAPGSAMVRFMLSHQLMLKGQYREGWLHMRARGELVSTPPDTWPRRLPRWEGQSLAGKHLLIWMDWGGLGDELQFARYLAPLARDYRPGRLTFGCSKEGQRLYGAIAGIDQASPAISNIAVDYQLPLLDLPIVYGHDLDNMPSGAPYLAAPAQEVARWAQRLASLPGRKIGLCWGSGFWGKNKPGDKAVPLAQLRPLAALRDVTLISLQKGPARQELPCEGLPIVDFDAELHDVTDTAALIQNLDAVVSVDTAVAHLAGAVGKPVLMMLKWESGNFWLLDREDSPWYPTMRILRQQIPRDWRGVAEQLLRALS